MGGSSRWPPGRAGRLLDLPHDEETSDDHHHFPNRSGAVAVDDAGFDEARLAAASFLARYSGRTLEAHRHDLRGFFQWAADKRIPVLVATRTTTIYDRRRQNFDRHAACVVVAFVAGG